MRARTNLRLDVAIGVAFLVAANPPVTGLAVHEWLGIAFGMALVAHLVLHWEWIVTATRRLFGGEGRGARLNYAVDVVLFVAVTAVTLSGLLISRHVLAALGLPSEPARVWTDIHSFAADVSIVAMGAHLGLHWNWLALNMPRLVTSNRWRAGGESVRTAGAASAGSSCASAAR